MFPGRLLYRNIVVLPGAYRWCRPLSSSLRLRDEGRGKKIYVDKIEGEDEPRIPNRLPKEMRVRLATACFRMREWGKAGKVGILISKSDSAGLYTHSTLCH